MMSVMSVARDGIRETTKIASFEFRQEKKNNQNKDPKITIS